MVKYTYPTNKKLRIFIEAIYDVNHSIVKYLPPINSQWYALISDCIEGVNHTSYYHEEKSIYLVAANLLYKVVKKHELVDGNKRSAVIAVFIFCFLNEYYVGYPAELKNQAKRIAKTKGRTNEDLMKRRVAESLRGIIFPFKD